LRVALCVTSLHTILAHLVLELARREDPSFDCELILGARAAAESSELLLRPEYWKAVRRFPGLHSEQGLVRGRKLIADWVTDHYPERPPCSVAMMGNDTDWRHQLLASLLGPAALWLFEDGIGSYVERSPSTRTTRVIYRNLVYKPFLRKAYWNSRGLSHSEAGRYFSLHPSAFPFRPDRSRMELLDVSSSAYARFLKQVDVGFSAPGPTAIITTQPLLEDGVVGSFDEETPMWRSLARYARDRVENVLVKPHPRESSENAVRRADVLRGAACPATVTVIPAPLPAEVLYLALSRVDLVLGAFSTSLATAVLLLPGTKVVAPLNSPAFAWRRGNGYQPAYHSALSRIGVEFLDLSARTRG
jgi:Alpha-2,8-polysialyltransferase (POLYST)